LLVLGCFIIIYLQCPCLTDFMNYLIHATPVHPSLCLQCLILLFTIATITAFILLLILLFYYYHHYKTIATDKLLRTSLFSGAAELTTHLLRLINILWLPLCQINKFGFYFPQRLLRSPILVGHQCSTPRPTAEFVRFCNPRRQDAHSPAYGLQVAGLWDTAVVGLQDTAVWVGLGREEVSSYLDVSVMVVDIVWTRD
jgi:hypothetical protein